MHCGEWLRNAEKQLKRAGIGTARLDALVILEHTLSTDRAHILASPDKDIPAEHLMTLESHMCMRVRHEPIAYILGSVEFYGRDFYVTPAVLVPRPESETMIELFRALSVTHPHIADVGSGSGALGITAALEKPTSSLTCIDIDEKTLDIAKKNAEKHNVSAAFAVGNLLEGCEETFDVLLCNLPYVPRSHTINQAAMREPSIAIFGGEDGLDLYRSLFAQLELGHNGSPVVLTESLPFQHDALQDIADKHGYKQVKEDDFIQHFER